MRVTVHLFAQMRVEAGVRTVELDLPPGSPLSHALDRFYEGHPGLRGFRPTTMAAVGLDYASPGHILREGDEISLIPPVQGG